MNVQVKCPRCGYVHQAHSAVRVSGSGKIETFDHDTPKPRAGDLSVCFECQAILQFNDELNPVRLLTDDFLDLSRDTQKSIVKARFAIREFKEFKKSQKDKTEEKETPGEVMSPFVRHFRKGTDAPTN